jgi:hypothetical protein
MRGRGIFLLGPQIKRIIHGAVKLKKLPDPSI